MIMGFVFPLQVSLLAAFLLGLVVLIGILLCPGVSHLVRLRQSGRTMDDVMDRCVPVSSSLLHDNLDNLAKWFIPCTKSGNSCCSLLNVSLFQP